MVLSIEAMRLRGHYARATPEQKQAIRLRSRRKGAARPDAEYGVQGDPCCYCGARMEHVDHVDPVARGGGGGWENLTAACAPCNLTKGARTLLVYLVERRRPTTTR
jgi:5-methylcytosine-specific restriction endonuclease McrA